MRGGADISKPSTGCVTFGQPLLPRRERYQPRQFRRVDKVLQEVRVGVALIERAAQFVERTGDELRESLRNRLGQIASSAAVMLMR